MSRIKSSLLGFIILCTTITAFGQDQITEPQECRNPSGSIPIGGDFEINPNLAACLNYATTTSKIVVYDYTTPDGNAPAFNSTWFLFNYKDSSGPPKFPVLATFDTTYTKPGTYWIMMLIKKGGNSYIKCKSVEVLQTPKLSLDYDICTTNTVTIKILPTPENQVYNAVSLDWGDGPATRHTIPNPIPSTGISLTHTYTGAIVNPKIQGLHIRDNIPACFGSPFTIPVTSSNIPKITILEGLNGGNENKITVKDGHEGSDYTVEMKTGNGVWTSTGKIITAAAANSPVSIIINGLTGTNDYCFRLQKTGVCNTPITSAPVCTIKSSYQVLTPKEVEVKWTSNSYSSSATSEVITRYKVCYKEVPANINGNCVNINVSATPSFIFDQMICSTKYEFYIEGGWGVGNDKVQILSPPFQVNPATGGRFPSAMVGVASVGDDFVRLSMNNFSNALINKYNIYKAEGNSTNFQPLTTVTTNTHSDYAVQLDKQQYCYKVDYQDDCGNTSDLSEAFCTIFLTSAQSNTLNWTPFTVSGSPNVLQNVQATEYVIQIIDASGTVINTPGNTLATEFDVQMAIDRYLNDPAMNGRVTFRILATQDANLVLNGNPISFPFFSYSNPYTFVTPALLYVPTAFTPNDDTFNDVFKANGKFISEFNMVIYNRWGAPIFESKNMDEGWDGKDNGTPAPPGNYSYKIFGLDHAGQEFKKVGSVVLLK
ncbi:gliding motility-associated C-terminal domain-containing protein [Emticicia sp. C21]|uniref:T9SS type B sorting domain-containing protein n=1 Tax=Emticicia sp. C21 TaxID=2302915 RepID=UPI000E345C1F|nr:gliding motility-associated C-terminal domain-containing protein [Emticicia sp. C21]RFS17933.1 gliding motility-associated C-terminal domain-containing protein [Emticicia sp. C21]